MIKTLADEFMDVMNNLDEGVTARRIEELYRDIKETEESLRRVEALPIKWLSTEKTHNGVRCHAWKICSNELTETLHPEKYPSIEELSNRPITKKERENSAKSIDTYNRLKKQPKKPDKASILKVEVDETLEDEVKS